MPTAASETDLLTELLRAYWFAPPVALWRAIELRVAAQETFSRPLLDLGCGDGLIAEALFHRTRVDVGIDPWLGQLRKAGRSGVYRWIQQADGHHMPFSDAAFATVFSNSVMEHIPDVAPVVQEVGRVLKPDGRFIFTVPSDAFHQLLYGYHRRLVRGDREGAEDYAAQIDRQLAHHHYHTPQEWSQLLARGGMEMEKAVYYIPKAVEHLWDRMNARFGVFGRSLWTLLASPRLRGSPHQRLMKRWVVQSLGRAWRSYYEQDIPAGQKGGGLLVVGRRRK
ncbi:MAG: class I SAM-dependent methyltransferase [Anaerolineae bacterium]|jgi:SAM-dependent methyltransferase